MGSGTLQTGFLHGLLSPDPLVSPLMPVEMTSEEIPDCGPAVSCCSCSSAHFFHRHKLLDPGPDLSSTLARRHRVGCCEDRGRGELQGPVESKRCDFDNVQCRLDLARVGLTHSPRAIHHQYQHHSPASYSFRLAITPNPLFLSLLISLQFLCFLKVEFHQTNWDFIRRLLILFSLLYLITLRTSGIFLEQSWNRLLLCLEPVTLLNIEQFSTGVETVKSAVSELTFSLTFTFTQFTESVIVWDSCKPGYTSERLSAQGEKQTTRPPSLPTDAIIFPQTDTKLWDESPFRSGITFKSSVCETKSSVRIFKRLKAGVFCDVFVPFLTAIFPLVATPGRASYTPRLFHHLPMGCILPKRQKNLGLEGDIKVYDLHAIIDPHPTTLIENSPTVLKYQTPHFRASARVRFPPVSGNDTWQIGWVQGCNNMDFTISYGNLGT